MFRSFRKLTRSGSILQSKCRHILEVSGEPSATASLPTTVRALNFSSTWKSSLSLDKLYPNSSLNPIKTPQIPKAEANKFSGFIPMDKLKITYSRSSGPGGMNVNCVSTKVDVRFHVDTADWLPEVIRNNMREKLRSGLSKDGYFIITSDRTRSQHYNLADALEKMREVIRSCEPVENPELSPESLEKIRRKREKAARERLREKRDRGNVKSSRGAAGGVSF